MTTTQNSGTPPVSAAPDVAWYALPADEAAARLEVDPLHGLTADEARRRLAAAGPNALAEAQPAPVWKQFLKHYREYMQVVLVAAAGVSLLIGEYGTAVGLTVLTLFNAWLGYHQEGKAEAAAAALGAMMKAVAKVRRDGDVTEVPAEDLVPGDIVLVDAGDRVPADGRVIVAATLQIEEGALTGESVAVEKSIDPVPGQDVAIGDRSDMAFMNTNVTRGHGEILVTTTGMGSEVGHIAHMLAEQKAEKSPLTKQVDRLTVFIILAALFAFVAIMVMGLAQGESFTVLFGIGVALAVGSIPDALPAVVTTILSVGSMNMAKKNAIMKSLPSVETLGSTSAINSDKTGTLTLNQMTVREITTVAHHYTVTGEGYSFDGQVQRTTGDEELNLDYVMFPCALCNDSDIQDGAVVGDPTEGALRARPEGRRRRQGVPREPPAHRLGPLRLRLQVHGDLPHHAGPRRHACGPGLPQGRTRRDPRPLDVRADGSGRTETLTVDMRATVLAENERIAAQGRRVLAFAQREFDPATFDPDGDLMTLMQDLEIAALVGEVDPPRAEATKAIAEARRAGIRVRMITGDHAITAGAIAHELGIEGRAVTGTEFAALSDQEAAEQIDEIGVIARVAPEHKVRLVDVLKARQNVVAMTGDGVNDAPAIGAADIGIAMGITGTDVAKGAAKMILADDNFATIVAAVQEGRSVYDNLQKFLRIQIANLFMFILAFLGSSAFAVAGTALLIPSQVLWIHMAVVAPIGAVMGLDLATPGIMGRAPRPFDQAIIVRSMMVRLFVAGLFMAAATLVLVQIGQSHYDSLQVGQSMAVVGLGIMNIALALNLRYPEDSAFGAATLANPKLLWAFAWAFLGSMLVTQLRVLQAVFDTTSLSGTQWAICLVPAVVLLALGELFKIVLRLRRGAAS